MVARINFASSLRNVMNYNENKLKQETEVVDKNGHKQKVKKAEFIHASGYAKDTAKLTFTDRYKRLEKLMALRESRTKSVTHISLNFDPSEKEKLDNEMLKKIADTYMQRIGFGDQPYLVYKHNDAGHPHIHIVSTIIRPDASAIETQWIGKNVSEPARKAIEQEFGLVVADRKKQKEHFELKPIDAAKAVYGRSGTKREITNVLDAVIPNYRYTSLTELNAVLRYYNVVADPGGPNSRIAKNNGLVYRILGEDGKKDGVQIKASDIYFNPGMNYLKERFTENAPLRAPHKQRIKNAIDLALLKKSVTTLQQLQDALKRDNIHLVPYYNKEGHLNGLTVVDRLKKVVFKASDVGTNYSAARIGERLSAKAGAQTQTEVTKQTQTTAGQPTQKPAPKQTTRPQPQPKREQPLPVKTEDPQTAHPPKQTVLLFGGPGLLDELEKPGQESQVPDDGTTKKKKRKKKRLHL